MDQKLTALALLDFSNGFGDVDFDILIAQLQYGLSGSVINWFDVTFLFVASIFRRGACVPTGTS